MPDADLQALRARLMAGRRAEPDGAYTYVLDGATLASDRLAGLLPGLSVTGADDALTVDRDRLLLRGTVRLPADAAASVEASVGAAPVTLRPDAPVTLAGLLTRVAPAWRLPAPLHAWAEAIALASLSLDPGPPAAITLELAAADPAATWPLLRAPVALALTQLGAELTLTAGAGVAGVVKGTLQAGPSALAVQVTLGEEAGGFTLGLDRTEQGPPPALADLLRLFEPAWVEALPADLRDLGDTVLLERFAVTVAPDATAVSAELASPPGWPGWTLGPHQSIHLEDFHLRLDAAQGQPPGGELSGRGTCFSLPAAVRITLAERGLVAEVAITAPPDLPELVHGAMDAEVPGFLSQVGLENLRLSFDAATRELAASAEAGDVSLLGAGRLEDVQLTAAFAPGANRVELTGAVQVAGFRFLIDLKYPFSTWAARVGRLNGVAQALKPAQVRNLVGSLAEGGWDPEATLRVARGAFAVPARAAVRAAVRVLGRERLPEIRAAASAAYEVADPMAVARLLRGAAGVPAGLGWAAAGVAAAGVAFAGLAAAGLVAVTVPQRQPALALEQLRLGPGGAAAGEVGSPRSDFGASEVIRASVRVVNPLTGQVVAWHWLRGDAEVGAGSARLTDDPAGSPLSFELAPLEPLVEGGYRLVVAAGDASTELPFAVHRDEGGIADDFTFSADQERQTGDIPSSVGAVTVECRLRNLTRFSRLSVTWSRDGNQVKEEVLPPDPAADAAVPCSFSLASDPRHVFAPGAYSVVLADRGTPLGAGAFTVRKVVRVTAVTAVVTPTATAVAPQASALRAAGGSDTGAARAPSAASDTSAVSPARGGSNVWVSFHVVSAPAGTRLAVEWYRSGERVPVPGGEPARVLDADMVGGEVFWGFYAQGGLPSGSWRVVVRGDADEVGHVDVTVP